MHSKVIIASLVCVLAASFNAGKGITANSAEAIQPEVKETVSRAPNDYQKNYWFSEQEGDTLYQFTVTVDFEKEYQSFQILRNDDDIEVNYSFYGDYADIRMVAPDSDGGHFVEFGYRSGSKNIVLATIYVYVRLGNYAASAYSMDDAKSRLFRYQEATYDELEYIRYRDESNFKYGYYTTYNPSRFNVEQSHADYVYGENDYEYNVSTSPRGNSTTTKLILHANWVDKNGNDYPLIGVRADFMTQNSLLGQGDLHFTDDDGEYVVNLTASQANQLKVNDIRCRLSSVCHATAVEDNFYQNYPLCYSFSNTTSLSNYSQLDLYLWIFADFSDRGAAYEITQAQSVPYNYVDTFTDTLDTIVTRFPTAHTDYVKNRVQFIDIQKEDAHSWDVLNHEYGHFICDQLGLCNVDSNRNPHNVHTNLGEDGIELAYSEGLATYLGLAAQMYYVGSFDVDGFGDELYQDTYRNLTVYYDRFAPSYGGSGRMYGERYETATTAMMIKMLDDVERWDDEVELGHAAMWNILLNSADEYCRNIVEFINVAVDTYPSYESAIRHMQEIEMIAEYIIHSYEKAAWTIMIYVSGANVQRYVLNDIAEILSVDNQPSNVNIIVEFGGATSWNVSNNYYGISASYINRYHVRNKQLIQDGNKLPQANMGNQSTLESFLDWGLRNYPAQKTGVIFWNHGGALDGVCYDYNYSHDALTATEVMNAFDNSLYRSRTSKFEFVAYNACLMQVQDIARYNSSYCNYMVASEELMPATGFAYDEWIDDVYAKKPTTTILTEIVNTYANNNYGWVTLSAIDLSKMNAYYNEFESMSSQIKTTVKNNKTVFKNILTSCKAYDFEYTRSYGTIDGYDFLNKLYYSDTFSSYRTKINTVMAKYNQLFVARRCGSSAGQSNGLALFCGLDHSGNSMSYPTTRFTSWKSVVTA